MLSFVLAQADINVVKGGYRITYTMLDSTNEKISRIIYGTNAATSIPY